MELNEGNDDKQQIFIEKRNYSNFRSEVDNCRIDFRGTKEAFMREQIETRFKFHVEKLRLEPKIPLIKKVPDIPLKLTKLEKVSTSSSEIETILIDHPNEKTAKMKSELKNKAPKFIGNHSESIEKEQQSISGIDEYKITVKKIKEANFDGKFVCEYKKQKVILKALTEEKWSKIKKESLIKEFDIHKIIFHHNIIRIHGWAVLNCESYGIVTEHLDGETLKKVIYDEAGYKRDQIIDWALQSAEALAYLHSKEDIKNLQREIKPSNMILSRDRRVLKYFDFGLPRNYTAYDECSFVSPIYVPPEVLAGKKYDTRCNVYSWAVTIWECINRVKPFRSCRSKSELFYTKMNRVFLLDYSPIIKPIKFEPIQVGDDLRELLNKCMQFHKEERPTMNEVVEELKKISPKHHREPIESSL